MIVPRLSPQTLLHHHRSRAIYHVYKALDQEVWVVKNGRKAPGYAYWNPFHYVHIGTEHIERSVGNDRQQEATRRVCNSLAEFSESHIFLFEIPSQRELKMIEVELETILPNTEVTFNVGSTTNSSASLACRTDVIKTIIRDAEEPTIN